MKKLLILFIVALLATTTAFADIKVSDVNVSGLVMFGFDQYKGQSNGRTIDLEYIELIGKHTINNNVDLYVNYRLGDNNVNSLYEGYIQYKSKYGATKLGKTAVPFLYSANGLVEKNAGLLQQKLITGQLNKGLRHDVTIKGFNVAVAAMDAANRTDGRNSLNTYSTTLDYAIYSNLKLGAGYYVSKLANGRYDERVGMFYTYKYKNFGLLGIFAFDRDRVRGASTTNDAVTEAQVDYTFSKALWKFENVKLICSYTEDDFDNITNLKTEERVTAQAQASIFKNVNVFTQYIKTWNTAGISGEVDNYCAFINYTF